MRSTKTKKIETAAQDRQATDETTIERLMQAMTAFMAASAEDEAAEPAQRAA